MRIPSVHQRATDQDDSFMTPMIDVVFLLLIFFVCASIGQIRESSLPTPLAAGSIEVNEAVDTPPPLGEVWLVLKLIESDGRSFTRAVLNDQDYDDWGRLKGVLRELAGAAPEIPVYLDVEKSVPIGDVIDIYDTCKAARFEQISFAISRQTR